METFIKSFEELSVEELFRILKARQDVFVVEQNCAYPDIDEADKKAVHIWMEDADGIVAYLRLLPKGVTLEEVAIGRVLSLKRRKGYAGRLLELAMKEAQRRYQADIIQLEAQVYAKSLYEKAGFVVTSEEFLEDGIPHVQMTWRKKTKTQEGS